MELVPTLPSPHLRASAFRCSAAASKHGYSPIRRNPYVRLISLPVPALNKDPCGVGVILASCCRKISVSRLECGKLTLHHMAARIRLSCDCHFFNNTERFSKHNTIMFPIPQHLWLPFRSFYYRSELNTAFTWSLACNGFFVRSGCCTSASARGGL